MNKFIKILLILSILALPNVCFGFQKNSIILNNAPERTFYSGTYDNLVLDFKLIVLKPDTLQALSLRDSAGASYLTQIKDMWLWSDQGTVGFQGLGIDQKIAKFSYSDSFATWSIDQLDIQVYDLTRFFVTIDTYYEITEPGTIKMQIPVFFDLNSNLKYDLGDKGIFMKSGDNGPIDMALENEYVQRFSDNLFDGWAPQISLSNLHNGSKINNYNFTIKGYARDQGNNDVNDLVIKINDQQFEITDYNPADYSWSYNWQNITNGLYSVQIQAQDDYGNIGRTDWLTIYAEQSNFSFSNSSVSLDKTEINNSGLDKISGQIIIKDLAGKPIIGQDVDIIASPGLIITKLNQLTNDDGAINFEIRATSFGQKKLAVKFAGQILEFLDINVVYNDKLPNFIAAGDLVKGSKPAVYLYGPDNKRHAFPNEQVFFSWYQDFKDVKIISDEKIAGMPLGNNVTFKPGNVLIKLKSENKVYAIDQNATLRWLENENVAQQIFGQNWGKMIKDLDDTFYYDYKQGTAITKFADYDPLLTLVNAEIVRTALVN